MASVHALRAATQDRKARLAQLKSLKRKQPDTQDEDSSETTEPAAKSPKHDDFTVSEQQRQQQQQQQQEQGEQQPHDTSKYLSGRNYDPETKGARLGFETAPSEGKATLEKQAAELALATKRAAHTDEQQPDRPLDLFQLQPRKPNWDLKRDLAAKLERVDVRTHNALARLARERLANQQKAAQQARAAATATSTGSAADVSHGSAAGDVEAAGIEGTTLVEATHIREREDEEEARREREEEDEGEGLLDGS